MPETDHDGRFFPRMSNAMTAMTIRIGCCLGLLLAVQTAALGNDPDLPEVQKGIARPAQYAAPLPAAAPVNGPYWAPGGDVYSGMRTGSPYYWSAPGNGAYGPAGYGAASGYGGYGAAPGWGAGYGTGYGGAGAGYGYGGGYGSGGMDPYMYHFGPGYYRTGAEQGSYRFPYYSYRRPWYTPGPASYNRDTNLPW